MNAILLAAMLNMGRGSRVYYALETGTVEAVETGERNVLWTLERMRDRSVSVWRRDDTVTTTS